MEYEDLEFENTPPDIVQKASDVCNNLVQAHQDKNMKSLTVTLWTGECKPR